MTSGNTTQRQPKIRAFCDSCREFGETDKMERVEGIWHCKSCAESIKAEAAEFRGEIR